MSTTLVTLLTLLDTVAVDTELRIQLPQTHLPLSFHVTEIGVVSKDFLDCGGTRRTESWLQLQAWVGPDHDHRLHPRKLAGILRKGVACGFAPDLPVRVECEDPTAPHPAAGLHRLVQMNARADQIVFHLQPVRTTCLAMDKCLPANLRPGASTESSSCRPDSPCCG